MKDILELTAHELRIAYENKDLTVSEVTKAYLNNISNEGMVNDFLQFHKLSY